MFLGGFVRYAGLAGGIGLLAGASCLACTDAEHQQGDPDSPVAPPVACTQIGCEDGLKVELRPMSGWPAGDYTFRIEADGVEVTCRGSLPLPDCSGSNAGVLGNVTCDTEGLVQIVESGCALPASAHAFPGVGFDPRLRPGNVKITVTRNGQRVGGADFVPSFQRVQPNGPDCPPTCEVASAVVQLEF